MYVSRGKHLRIGYVINDIYEYLYPQYETRDQLWVSTLYGVHSITGLTTGNHIVDKHLEKAKSLLVDKDVLPTVSELMEMLVHLENAWYAAFRR